MDDVPDDSFGGIGFMPICAACGSERILRDASATWNPAYGLWEVAGVQDYTYCEVCDREASLTWVAVNAGPSERVRVRNDAFRRNGLGRGAIHLTPGVQERGAAFVRATLAAISSFDAFTPDNDPWGEHDFGQVEVLGQTVYWKIDCLGTNLRGMAENPANPLTSHRALTVMLPDEF